MNLSSEVMAFASFLAVVLSPLVQVIKVSFQPNERLVPIISIIMGLLIGLVAYPFSDMTLILRLWAGGIAGLMAVGLFETGKNTYRFIRNRENKEP